VDEVRVGNLNVVRDLLDVRDGVKAMWIVAQHARPGEVYNICAGVGYEIREILERLIVLSGAQAQIHEDRARLRRLDEPAIVGDNAKLRLLGWKEETPLAETLARTLHYWRHVQSKSGRDQWRRIIARGGRYCLGGRVSTRTRFT
jgi:GDP-4-dehydro-6-deoxy-D-mannose reductase